MEQRLTNYKHRLEARGERNAKDFYGELATISKAQEIINFCDGHADLAPIVLRMAEALESWIKWERGQVAKEGPYSGEKIRALIATGEEVIAHWERYLDGKDEE